MLWVKKSRFHRTLEKTAKEAAIFKLVPSPPIFCLVGSQVTQAPCINRMCPFSGLHEKFNIVEQLNVETHFTYLKPVFFLLLFLCNLGSIHGHALWFCSSLFAFSVQPGLNSWPSWLYGIAARCLFCVIFLKNVNRS